MTLRDVGRILSMYTGPDDALVTLDLDFDEGTAAADAALVPAGCDPCPHRTDRQVRGACARVNLIGLELLQPSQQAGACAWAAARFRWQALEHDVV